MTDDRTVQADRSEGQSETPRQTARATLGDRVPPSVESSDGTTGKRKRTGGEILFDVTTYGGFALVGNEVVSTAIVKAAEKPTAFGRLYERAGELTRQFAPKGLNYAQSGRLNHINFAVIGGFTMVPIIKYLEDNKGKLVRFADRVLHGKKAQTNPDIVSAHHEMDNAPQQSWGSLMKGRILTVLAAWGVDASINWKGGLSSRMLKGTSLERFSSLEAVGDHAAEKLGNRISASRGLDMAKTASLKGWLSTGFSLLGLSSALTILFYVSSKLFASRRENRREIYAEVHQNAPAPLRDEVSADAQAPEKNDAPMPTVNAIAHEARLAAAPEHGKGA